MGNPQKVKFQDVDEVLTHLPHSELVIVQQLRSIVLNCLHDGGYERLSYNAPFYYYHGQMCFIWPASIPWGKLKHGVALGFIQGRKLSQGQNLLEFEGRKYVGRMIFTEPTQLDQTLIESMIFEAMAINEERRKR